MTFRVVFRLMQPLGHGVEADGRFFCCAHCASMAGVSGIADRA
jgi:hypothetical protein